MRSCLVFLLLCLPGCVTNVVWKDALQDRYQTVTRPEATKPDSVHMALRDARGRLHLQTRYSDGTLRYHRSRSGGFQNWPATGVAPQALVEVDWVLFPSEWRQPQSEVSDLRVEGRHLVRCVGDELVVVARFPVRAVTRNGKKLPPSGHEVGVAVVATPFAIGLDLATLPLQLLIVPFVPQIWR
jgi:hypothetical protein